jgi:hypothetical protein
MQKTRVPATLMVVSTPIRFWFLNTRKRVIERFNEIVRMLKAD